MANSATTGIAADDDPFTGVYQRIWAILRASVNWMAALQSAGLDARTLQPGNLRDLTLPAVSRANPKQTLAPANLPEVSLLQAAFDFQPFGSNSKISEVTQTFVLVAATETLDIEPLNRIKWFTGAALMKAGDDLGLAYVRGWRITSAYDGQNPIIAGGVHALHGNNQRQATLLNISVAIYAARTVLASLGA